MVVDRFQRIGYRVGYYRFEELPSSPNKFAGETESNRGGERQARARNSPGGRSRETRRVFRALRQESVVGSFFVGRS